MNPTYVSIARQWSHGEITDETVIDMVQKISPPIKHVDIDGIWYDGDNDNTMEAVSAILNFDDFIKFQELLVTAYKKK